MGVWRGRGGRGRAVAAQHSAAGHTRLARKRHAGWAAHSQRVNLEAGQRLGDPGVEGLALAQPQLFVWRDVKVAVGRGQGGSGGQGAGERERVRAGVWAVAVVGQAQQLTCEIAHPVVAPVRSPCSVAAWRNQQQQVSSTPHHTLCTGSHEGHTLLAAHVATGDESPAGAGVVALPGGQQVLDVGRGTVHGAVTPGGEDGGCGGERGTGTG